MDLDEAVSKAFLGKIMVSTARGLLPKTTADDGDLTCIMSLLGRVPTVLEAEEIVRLWADKCAHFETVRAKVLGGV